VRDDDGSPPGTPKLTLSERFILHLWLERGSGGDIDCGAPRPTYWGLTGGYAAVTGLSPARIDAAFDALLSKGALVQTGIWFPSDPKEPEEPYYSTAGRFPEGFLCALPPGITTQQWERLHNGEAEAVVAEAHDELDRYSAWRAKRAARR